MINEGSSKCRQKQKSPRLTVKKLQFFILNQRQRRISYKEKIMLTASTHFILSLMDCKSPRTVISNNASKLERRSH